MALPIQPPYPPMEAKSVDSIPDGSGWQYEPKWDGFRCLAFRDGDTVELQSKAGQPLGRYFPEVVAAVKALKPRKFVLDGEIVVPVKEALSFDQLLQRIHPAASRIAKLSAEFPAIYIVFDLLVNDRGSKLADEPLSRRRDALEQFSAANLKTGAAIRLSPATTAYADAKKWFEATGAALDGVIAKRLDLEYRSGDRTGMQKVKKLRTAECVVGGYRYGSKATRVLGSLLLGLYDEEGLLHHVGFCSSFTAQQRRELTPKIEKLRLPVDKGGGFTGKAPGGPSRWSTERSGEWESVRPNLVVEIRYDHFTGGRFRHGTGFLRWRPDKPASKCTLDQVTGNRPSVKILSGAPGALKRSKRSKPPKAKRPAAKRISRRAKG